MLEHGLQERARGHHREKQRILNPKKMLCKGLWLAPGFDYKTLMPNPVITQGLQSTGGLPPFFLGS